MVITRSISSPHEKRLPVAGDDLESVFQRCRHNELGFTEARQVRVVDQNDTALVHWRGLVRIEVPAAAVFAVRMRTVEI